MNFEDPTEHEFSELPDWLVYHTDTRLELPRKFPGNHKNIVIPFTQEIRDTYEIAGWHDYLCEISALTHRQIWFVTNTINYLRHRISINSELPYNLVEFPHRFGYFELWAHELYQDSYTDKVKWNPDNSDIVYMAGKNHTRARIFPTVAIATSDLGNRFRHSFSPDPKTKAGWEHSQYFEHTWLLSDSVYNLYGSELDVSMSDMVVETSQWQPEGYIHYTGRPVRNTDIYNSGRIFLVAETVVSGNNFPGHCGNNTEAGELIKQWYTEKTYRHILMGLPVLVTNRPDFSEFLVRSGFCDITQYYGPDYVKYNQSIESCHDMFFKWQPEHQKYLTQAIKYFDKQCETNYNAIQADLRYNSDLMKSGDLWRNIDSTLTSGVCKLVDQATRYTNHTQNPDLTPGQM